MAGRKNNIKQFNIIAAGDMSTSPSGLTSSVTDIQFLDDIGIQFTWSGSPTGSVQVHVSADYNQDLNGNVVNAGHWAPLTLSYWDGAAMVTATSIPTSVGSPIYIDLALLSAPYIRAVYVYGSGTGTLTATITAKML